MNTNTQAATQTQITAKAFFLQALDAIRQGQCLNDYLLHTKINNRPIARRSYLAAQKHEEHAALCAVADAVNNLPQAIYGMLDNIGCDGNAIELREALANLAAIRAGKGVES